MAIQDYIPKLDVGYDANQAYANANDSMRNIGQIQKATADTTAQGWKALQDAFNAFAEQNIQNRGLDLKEKDITGTEAYRNRTLDLQNAQQDWTKTNDQSKNAFEMYKLGKLADESALDRAARLEAERMQTGRQRKEKEDPQPRETFLELASIYSDRNPKGELVTFITQDPVTGKAFVDWKAMRKQYQDVNQLLPRYSQVLDTYGMDAGKKAKYIQAFKEWFATGETPTVPIAPASTPAPGAPAKRVDDYGSDTDAWTRAWGMMKNLGNLKTDIIDKPERPNR